MCTSGYVPAGFYIYEKKDSALYGSLFGLDFSFEGGEAFAVGMDCPLTVLGGTNSVRVFGSAGAGKAAKLANDSGYSEDSVVLGSGKKVSIKRASGSGSVNWGVCVVE